MKTRTVTVLDEQDTIAILEYLDQLRDLVDRLIERKSLPAFDDDSGLDLDEIF